VPFGNTTNPGLEGFPVFANETQFEPAKGAAHAGFDEIFCVAFPELLVVFVAELSIGVESARAVKKLPLAMIARAKVINFFIIQFLRVRQHCGWHLRYNYIHRKSIAIVSMQIMKAL
jgi:hypothetical protein